MYIRPLTKIQQNLLVKCVILLFLLTNIIYATLIRSSTCVCTCMVIHFSPNHYCYNKMEENAVHISYMYLDPIKYASALVFFTKMSMSYKCDNISLQWQNLHNKRAQKGPRSLTWGKGQGSQWSNLLSTINDAIYQIWKFCAL